MKQTVVVWNNSTLIYITWVKYEPIDNTTEINTVQWIYVKYDYKYKLESK